MGEMRSFQAFVGACAALLIPLTCCDIVREMLSNPGKYAKSKGFWAAWAAALLLLTSGGSASAEKVADPAPGEPGAATGADAPLPTAADGAPAAGRVSSTKDDKSQWKDILVIPRKAFLKQRRLELAPYFGVTMNDALIRHYAFGGQINYWVTDVLGVGLEGTYFRKDLTDATVLIQSQYFRIPTLNQLRFGGFLNFQYVPVYGKFTFFNRGIVHWEALLDIGIGMTNTEIIPRDASAQTFTSNNITPLIGFGGRIFLTDFMTFYFTLRDMISQDKFEPTSRMPNDPIAQVQNNADGQIVNNVLLTIGLSFYIPPRFDYSTLR